MIKLIVSDLDGTLLNDEKTLPEDFGALLDALDEKGIAFATGSGRTYFSQQPLFADYAEKMNLICDNGAYIVEKGACIFASVIPDAEWRRVCAYLEPRLPGAAIVLCGMNGTYARPYASAASAEIMALTFFGVRFVDSLEDVRDEIFKVAICNPYAAPETLSLLSEYELGPLKDLHSDDSFVDFINADVSKGRAVELFQRRYGVTRGETMVFGDYYNDVEMLAQADFSYVMENAPADLRAHGRFLAPDNNTGGVAQVIREYLNSL